jgi:hypothetical protein
VLKTFASCSSATVPRRPHQTPHAFRSTLEVLDGLFAQVLTVDDVLQKISPASP